MTKKVITPKGFSDPLAPYSRGVLCDNVLYVAGVVSLDVNGELVGTNDIRKQTRQALENVGAVLLAAGGSFEDVVSNTIYLKTFDDYAGMNEVYREFFSTALPARACVKAELVKPEFLVEIVSIAHLAKT